MNKETSSGLNGNKEFRSDWQVNNLTIDHFTVVAKLPGLRMEERLPVTLFCLRAFVMLIWTN